MPDSIPNASEDFSIFMGELIPIVGRPIIIVTYRRQTLSESDERRESAVYAAFFTKNRDSFSAALSQRVYRHGVYPRLGAKEMIERARDEGALALGDWLTRWLQGHEQTTVEVEPLPLRKIDVDTLFGLYVFSPDVRACVKEVQSAVEHERLQTLLSRWSFEVGVNTVSLHTSNGT